MEPGLIVTIAIAVMGWLASLAGVWKQMSEKTVELEKTQNDKRGELAENLWKAINENGKEFWKAINDNTRQMEQLIGKVDRELTAQKGDLTTQIVALSGRIDTLDQFFWENKRTKAAMYLHKPDEAAKAMDARVDKLLDKLDTKQDGEERKKALLAEVMSLRQDTGERALLQAEYQLDVPKTEMPVEPLGKALDQTFKEKREQGFIDYTKHAKREIQKMTIEEDPAPPDPSVEPPPPDKETP